jgi:hypothetical protein
VLVASERKTERGVSARPLKAVDPENPNGEERTVNTDVALPLEPVNERIQTLLGQLLPDGLRARVRVVKVRLAVVGLAVGRLPRLASSELTDIEDLDVVLEPLPDKKSERDGKDDVSEERGKATFDGEVTHLQVSHELVGQVRLSSSRQSNLKHQERNCSEWRISVDAKQAVVGHSETHHRNDDLGPRVVRLAHWTTTKPKEDGDDQDRQRPVDELGGRIEEDAPVLPIPVTEGARVGALEFFLLRAVLRSSSLRLRMEHAEDPKQRTISAFLQAAVP